MLVFASSSTSSDFSKVIQFLVIGQGIVDRALVDTLYSYFDIWFRSLRNIDLLLAITKQIPSSQGN